MVVADIVGKEWDYVRHPFNGEWTEKMLQSAALFQIQAVDGVAAIMQQNCCEEHEPLSSV